jgi:hypothetical protein
VESKEIKPTNLAGVFLLVMGVRGRMGAIIRL